MKLSEIEEFIENKIEQKKFQNNVEIDVNCRLFGGDLHINISTRDYIDLEDCVNFDLLVSISELLNTKNINFERSEYGGCDTCGFGAHKEVDIEVSNLGVEVEL